jgi:hypothetical protein
VFDGSNDRRRGFGGVAGLRAVDGVMFLSSLACGVGVVVDAAADWVSERPAKSVRNAPGSTMVTEIPSGAS